MQNKQKGDDIIMPDIERPKKFDKNQYDKEYHKKMYSNIGLKIKREEAERLKQAAQDRGISLQQYIIRSSNYIIDNNIDLD